MSLINNITNSLSGLLGVDDDKLDLLAEFNNQEPSQITDTNMMIGGQPHVNTPPPPPPPQAPPEEEKGFFTNLWEDEERMARMTIALNSMRMNPDPNIAKSMEAKIARVQKSKGSTKTANALRAMGRDDLADLVEKGQLDAKTAVSLAYQKPSAFQEKMDLFKKDPDAFAAAKDAGVIGGGGTTINMGDNRAYYDAVGKDIVDMKKTWRERGELANASLRTYQALDVALKNFGDTGPGSETMQQLRELGARVGMPIDENKLGDGQYLQALKNRMVAEELRKNKGPQTDFDAKFAGTYIPGLGNTTEANRQILNYSKSISLQQTILANMANNIRSSDPEQAVMAIRNIDNLALMSPGAMERKDGTWITFSEFFNSDAIVSIEGVEQQLNSMSALERMNLWSDNYKKRMGFR